MTSFIVLLEVQYCCIRLPAGIPKIYSNLFSKMMYKLIILYLKIIQIDLTKRKAIVKIKMRDD